MNINIVFPLNQIHADYQYWLNIHTDICRSFNNDFKEIISQYQIYYIIFIKTCKSNILPHFPILYRNYLLSLPLDYPFVYKYIGMFVDKLIQIGYTTFNYYNFLISNDINSYNLLMSNLANINDMLIHFEQYKIDNAIKNKLINTELNTDINTDTYMDIEIDNQLHHISLIDLGNILDLPLYTDIIDMIRLPELFTVIKFLRHNCITVDLDLVKLFEFKKIIEILDDIKPTEIPIDAWYDSDTYLSDVD